MAESLPIRDQGRSTDTRLDKEYREPVLVFSGGGVTMSRTPKEKSITITKEVAQDVLDTFDSAMDWGAEFDLETVEFLEKLKTIWRN